MIKKNKLLFLSKEVDLDPNNMKELAFELGNEIDNLFLVLGTQKNNKPMLCCYISKDLVKANNYDAAEIVKKLGIYIEGSGGGKKASEAKKLGITIMSAEEFMKLIEEVKLK